MALGNEVLTYRDYGHVELRLREIMQAEGISRNALARRANTRFEVIDKWYRGEVEKIDLDVLARVCFALGRDVGEILTYRRETE